MSDEKRFDKALVIFIDILGSQSRNDFNELFKLNELFHSELLENRHQDREYTAYQRHIYTFSDCAYIIYDYKNKSTSDLGALFDVALLNCEPLLMKFLSEGLVIRGGAAYGDVYYDENKNMFFGDAVNKAYQYESKIAKYPRIVLDEYVAEEVIKYTKKVDKQSKKRSKNGSLDFDDHVGCIVSLDSDRKYFLNYFNSIQHGRDYSQIINKSNKQFLEDIKLMCNERIALFRENENVRSKYEWLQAYTEMSKNECIDKAVVFKKPFWDKVFGQVLPDDMSLIKDHLIMPNVGICISDEERHEIFEKFNSPEVLAALWQVGETDEI